MSKDIVIGVLAYNVEDYITSVVDELIELNLPIYIIDDCSTDDSASLIKSYNDSRINFFKTVEDLNQEIFVDDNFNKWKKSQLTKIKTSIGKNT